MLLTFGTRFGQKLAKVHFWNFNLHYHKYRHLVTVQFFLKNEALLIFGSKLGLEVQQVTIIKFICIIRNNII